MKLCYLVASTNQPATSNYIGRIVTAFVGFIPRPIVKPRIVFKAASRCKAKFCNPRGACEWVLKALQCQSTDETRVYQHHFHLSAAPPSREPNELNYAMKRFIEEHAEAGEKPAHIMHAMVAALNIEEADPAVQLPRVLSVVRTFRAKSLLKNDYVDVMQALASKHRFRDDLGEITAFAFGFDCDTEVEPDIGKGTADVPLVVVFLTKKLIRRLERAPECVFHLDATFKLNNKGFPVVVMGLSDMWRQFHSVALFLMSDLKQPQWNRAIRAVCELYRRVCSSSVSLSHVMVDADNAQRSAFEKVASELLAADKQPDFLMCFFHVMTNDYKHTATFSKKDKQLIYKHVYRIHYARTPEDKKPRVDEALVAWQVSSQCRKFSDYFNEHWQTGRYTKWQCFETPTEKAKANNPVENFNRQLKNHIPFAVYYVSVKVCHTRSILTRPFATLTRAAPHIVRDNRKLLGQNLLSVTNADRASIAFLTPAEPSHGEFRVYQHFPMATSSSKKKHSPEEDENITIQELEVHEQCGLGWRVQMDDGSCTCRSMFKLGCCVRIMAVQDRLGLPFDGSPPPRETFPDKRRHKNEDARPKSVMR